jgi:hypothetical protein
MIPDLSIEMDNLDEVPNRELRDLRDRGRAATRAPGASERNVSFSQLVIELSLTMWA